MFERTDGASRPRRPLGRTIPRGVRTLQAARGRSWMLPLTSNRSVCANRSSKRARAPTKSDIVLDFFAGVRSLPHHQGFGAGLSAAPEAKLPIVMVVTAVPLG